MATHYFVTQNYGRAFSLHLLLLKSAGTNKSAKRVIHTEFVETWRIWSEKMCLYRRFKDLLKIYGDACLVYDECYELHFIMAERLHELTLYFQSVQTFAKCLSLRPASIEALACLENACTNVMACWHHTMLNDHHRNAKYNRAINDLVISTYPELATLPVLDLGAGTGLLAMMAAKHGCAEVHACEESALMCSIAKECVKGNKFEDRVKLLRKHSSQLSHKRKYSAVICEVFDAGLFGERVVESLVHAWKHLLVKDGGRVLPRRAVVKSAIVECPVLRRKHTYVGGELVVTSGASVEAEDSSASINFTPLEPYTCERLADFKHRVLSQTVTMMTVNFNDRRQLRHIVAEKVADLSCAYAMTKAGSADAVITWMELHLDRAGQQVISCEPGSHYCWDQAVYPIRSSSGCGGCKRVRQGDRLTCGFSVHADALRMRTVTCRNQHAAAAAPVGDHQHLILHEELVLKCNDARLQDAYFNQVADFCALRLAEVGSSVKTVKILLLADGFELLAVRLLERYAPQRCIELHHLCDDEAAAANLERLYRRWGDRVDVRVHNDVKVVLQSCNSFDVLVAANVVAASGLAVRGAVSQLLLCKSVLTKDALVIPQRVEMLGECWMSEELLSRCMVLGSGRTSGFEIGKYMNPYCMSCFSGFSAHAVKHRALTSRFSIFEDVITAQYEGLDEEDLTLERTLTARATAAGCLHAVAVSWRIHVGDAVFDTSENDDDDTNHWSQAAFVFSRSKEFLPLRDGQKLVLKAVMRDEMFMFLASRYVGDTASAEAGGDVGAVKTEQ